MLFYIMQHVRYFSIFNVNFAKCAYLNDMFSDLVVGLGLVEREAILEVEAGPETGEGMVTYLISL